MSDETLSSSALALTDPETPEQALVMLDRARAALDAAIDFQQVRHCRTLAVAAAAYAREAKDSTLIERASRLKVQAERRAGQMLAESAERGERAMQGDGVKFGANRHLSDKTTSVPTLANIGVTKTQSQEWQALARLSPGEFDASVNAVAAADGRVTGASVLATAYASRPPPTLPKHATDAPKRRKGAASSASEHRRAVLDATTPATPIVAHAKNLARLVREASSFTAEEVRALADLAAVLDIAAALAFQQGISS